MSRDGAVPQADGHGGDLDPELADERLAKDLAYEMHQACSGHFWQMTLQPHFTLKQVRRAIEIFGQKQRHFVPVVCFLSSRTVVRFNQVG